MFKKILLVVVTIIVFFTIYTIVDINRVKITEYQISSPKLSADFNNYKIALIADFHNSRNFRKIIGKVNQISPNIIAFAGDSISMNDVYPGNLMWLVEELRTIAPIYFISGNHEVWSENHEELLTRLENHDVNIINNKVVELTHGEGRINLIGYKDIIYADHVMRLENMKNELTELFEKTENKELFNLLLFHRANYFDIVSEYPFNLVLSGHTHGGQINLPYIRDIILEKKINSSKYVKGMYEKNDSIMIVSGGVDISPRIFNTPEVVSIILKAER